MAPLQLVERLRGEEMPELEAQVERTRGRSAAGDADAYRQAVVAHYRPLHKILD